MGSMGVKTMKAVVLLALAVAVLASEENVLQPKIVEVPVPARNATETRYVKHAHRATLNFACPVDSIVVTPNFDNIDPSVEDPIVQVELEDHLGEVGSIQWAHIMQTYFQGTDPRGQERELSALGGDLGEFLIVLVPSRPNSDRSLRPRRSRQSLRRTSQSCPKKSSSTRLLPTLLRSAFAPL